MSITSQGDNDYFYYSLITNMQLNDGLQLSFPQEPINFREQFGRLQGLSGTHTGATEEKPVKSLSVLATALPPSSETSGARYILRFMYVYLDFRR